MSELFSNIRVIDYFIIFETSILSIDTTSYNELIDRLSKGLTLKKKTMLNIDYQYNTLNILPKYNYKKDNPDFYTLNIDSILTFLPQEHAFLDQQNELYFPLIFTSENGTYYYGHFLRMFFKIDFQNKIYEQYPELLINKIPLYSSKYICFISLNPFFISFKNLLVEIYNQSLTNNAKCFKVESILNTILFRMTLPKYEATQLLFCLGENVYTFSKTPFKNEISFRLLFSYISIKNIVMIIISILMNSIVVIIHSNMEIITPIIHSLFELVFPFLSTYSIVSNLTPGKIDLLGNFSNTIFGVYSKDFKDLSEIKNANNSNYVILDIDKNKLDIEHNEYFQQKFPISRIKKLIKDLCQFADIFQNQGAINDDSSILSFFQNKNVNTFDQYKSYTKVNFRTKNYFNSKKSNEEKFDDSLIRASFFDFMLGLFEKYDEKKHYKISNEATQDKIFDREKFLKDAPLDIQPFLEYIVDQQTFDIFLQNVNHIVDQKHKNELKKLSYKYGNLEIKRNPEIREKSLIPDFELTYKVFMYGLERRRNRKNLEMLFKVNIYHTISISSPPFENLPYHQTNIFNDPICETGIKHEKGVIYNEVNLELNMLHINLEEQKGLIPSLLYKEYDELIKSKSNKNHANKKVKLNEILTRISTELFSEQKKEPIIIEFKQMLSKYSSLIKKFYGLSSQETKNYLKKIIETSKNKLFLGTNKQQIIDKNSNQSKISKRDFITASNLLINNFPRELYIGSQNEYRINFGLNMIYSVAFCDYCSKPNSIWDIRKEHEYKQLKNASITKCKFCQQNFIPCFYVIEEEEKANSNLLKMNTITTSSTPFQYYKTKSIRKVEFMCYEHIVDSYTEFFNILEDPNMTNVPKFPYELFYNICVLLGEINCILEKNQKIKLETLNMFITNYFINNPEATSNYGGRSNSIGKKSLSFAKTSGSLTNKPKNYKNGNLTGRNKVNAQNYKKKRKQSSGKKTKNAMTIKLNLVDLVDEKRYLLLQKDINKIPVFTTKGKK